MTMALQRAPKLRDQVYQAVRTMLREGTFPESGLAEEDLAELLKVSRTPIREALFQLCREGVLEDAGRGYRVPEPTVEDVTEIMQLRRLIEPAIARSIVLGKDETLIANFRDAVGAEQKAVEIPDARAFIAANARFRANFLSGSGSRRITQVMQTIDDQVARLRQRTLGPVENRKATLDCHLAFLEALMRGDEDGAERAVHRLLDAAGAYYALTW